MGVRLNAKEHGNNRVFIYCSGGIAKGSDQKKICWTDYERRQIALNASPYDIEFLDPAASVPHLEDLEAQFGRDMFQINISDFVVVDAREKRGVGIGIEMLAAKIAQKPLIVVMQKNSHYWKDTLSLRGTTVENYMHPHIFSLCDEVVEDFSKAGEIIKDYLSGNKKPKGADAIEKAIEAYCIRVLPDDIDMKQTKDFRIEASMMQSVASL